MAMLRRMLAGRGTIVTALFLTAVLLPTAASATALHPAVVGSPQSWAYGASSWQNDTALSSAYTETVRTYVGIQVITSMTNTSSTVYEMQTVETVAESYFVQYCQPSCSAAQTTENYSEHYLEVVNEWANLTRAATVTEGSTKAAAFGILNATSAYSENLTEFYLGLKGSSIWYTGHYDLEYTAATSIAFTPALGLIPVTSSTGLTWNATSAYSASGGWLESYSYYFTEPTIGYNASDSLPSYSGSDTYTGNESVYGRDLGPVTLSGGATARSIDLSYSGAYDIALGYLLTPSGNEIFEGNSGWSVGITPAAVAASTVDVATSGGSNTPEIIGAQTNWTVGPSTPPGSAGSGGSPGQVSVPTNTGNLQAQPEPLPYAQATSRCLVGSCPTTSLPSVPSASYSGSMGEFAIALAITATLGAAFLWAVRSRGGRRPPTPGTIPAGARGHAPPP